MNSLEQQLAALLTDAPGEPPNAIDPDALLADAPRRRRWIAPALAAAAVVAVAIPIAVVVADGSHSHRPEPLAPLPGPTDNTSPKTAAIKAVEAALAAAPLPGGAREVTHLIAGLNAPFSETASPDQVSRNRWFTVSGNVAALISYLKEHPPAGMTFEGTGTSGGGGGPSISAIDFEGPSRLTMTYSATAYRGGVAVRVDAITVWVPNRPRWSYITGTIDSVDVTIVRTNPQLHRGAPTVHRMLTGADARSLAAAVNRPGLLPDYGPHSCPAMLTGTRWFDQLVFQTDSGSWRVVESMMGCAYLSVADGHHKQVLLDASIDRTVLTAIDLPGNYGSRN